MLVIVCYQGRALADTIAVCRDTVAVEHVLSGTANDAVVRSCAGTRAAKWGARGARCSAAEATIRTDGSGRGRRLYSKALGAIVGVLGEAGLAGYAVSGAVRTLSATQLTC